MRLLFLGSGEFGLPTLRRLHRDHDIAAVISQPDRPAGRKRVLTPTPIAAWAAEQGLPVLREENVNTPEFIEQTRAFHADASVIIAFGQKLSPPFIDALGKLAVNLHASLLPKYRGAAPINWAMIRGERVTGVSVIGLAQRMDAGPVYAAATLPIDPLETAGELHDRLAELGPPCIGQVLDDLANGTLHPVEQDESQATKAPKFTKTDGTVDFNQPAPAVRARIHGLTPWPGCRVAWHQGDGSAPRELILHRVRDHMDPPAATASAAPGTILPNSHIASSAGTLELLELQAPGSRPMTYADFIHGHKLTPGDRLSAMG